MDNKIKDKIKFLVDKYNYKTLMYTEYPHKRFWKNDADESDYKKALTLLSKERENTPLMLYVHIPFCRMQCFYCTCHTCITSDYKEVKDFLEVLYKEMDILKDYFEKNSINPKFLEVHLGGGSPTILDNEDLDILIKKIDNLVDIKSLREFSMEIDPRIVTREKLLYYKNKGINRISYGIQDFDYEVQKAVNRIQPVELIEKLMTPEIRSWFPHGINFDILCGLPNQTIESIKKTFETVVRLSPDRICFNSLDFSPKFAKHQFIMIDGKNGRPQKLPDEFERKMIFLTAQEILIKNNYNKIGYDHFAKSIDEVVKSLEERKMKWNALGVTTGDYSDVIGIGPHSMSTIGNFYFQNLYFKEGYMDKLKEGKLPLYKSYMLNNDDIIRREVIQIIRNFGHLDFNEFNKKFNIDFKDYFDDELVELNELISDGIIEINENFIEVTSLGKEFVLFVCMKFDSFLKSIK